MTVHSPLEPASELFAPDVQDEVLCHSERTKVVRRRLAAGNTSVVCKEVLGASASVRLRHEGAMLERLSSVPGVARLVTVPDGARMLVLEDVSGRSLAEVIQRGGLSVSQQVDLALELTRIVAKVHRHGIVHRDINPTNILVSGPTRQVTLIDFNLASTFAEERPGFTHEREITGTLAYIAPEQTGRTGRPVDQRADMYSLGATLYELATGSPPFGDGDLLQLIRDHLARLPTPPSLLDPGIPASLSDIVMRLLEKEPDRRYQSADGLAHDLQRLRDHLPCSQLARFPLGGRDFALRLSAPSRLIGREAEIGVLRQAFEESLRMERRGVLVAGAPGVGKSSLVGELRPMATARGGWFVSGKFDQYRQEAATPAITQALRALGRLLLAEPKEDLDRQRAHILAALGPQAGLVTAAFPEFLLLLGSQAAVAAEGPAELEAQVLQATIALLGAIVSPSRPLVMVIDDLQWALPVSLRMIERLLVDPALRGLLVVGTYRDAEIDAAHPLAAMLPRWQLLRAAPLRVPLQNLPPTDVAELVAEMLRLPLAEARNLGRALGTLTGGNPFDTVELINALRRDGALHCGDDGWQWDPNDLRRYVGQGTVVDLIAARIGTLPPETRQLMEAMACLGNSVGMALLQAATGIGADELHATLREALEDGLLILGLNDDAGSSGSVRFRHDRVQQAAHGRLDATQREELHLALARRLLTHPDWQFQAAEQYLQATRAVQNVQERRQVAGLFQAAAERARERISQGATARWLGEAMTMLSAIGDTADQPVIAVLEIELHAALYALGKLDEADRVYSAIEARGSEPLGMVDATCTQISSLCNRNHLDKAVELGLGLLRRFGLRVDETHAGLAAVRSHQSLVRDDDALRPEVTDPHVIAFGKLFNRLIPAMDVCDWMVLESRRLWVEHGPCAPLVGPVGHIGFVTIPEGDYRSAYNDVRGVLAVGEARGYEPQTSQARFLFAFSASHWFEPLEETVAHAQRAREGLLQGGDVQNACFSYFPTISAVFDCAALLDGVVDEIESAIALAARTGNENAGDPFVLQRQLAYELQGQTQGPSELADASFVGGEYLAEQGRNQFTMASLHIACALAAALFGNDEGLLRHTEEANRRPRYAACFYSSALAQLLHALALSKRIRTALEPQRGALLAELDTLSKWWQRRAIDAPVNFGHLSWLVKAEQAAAEGDFSAAVRAFDTAMREVEPRQRPWHRAFITERAGLFHLEHGMVHTGRKLLVDARFMYEEWGANGKVQMMDRSHSFLRPRPITNNQAGTRNSSSISPDAIDLMGVLRASQALSSETSLARLTLRVGELLGAMTGATSVSVALWQDELDEWCLLAPAPDGVAAQSIPVTHAGASGLLPRTAFRYVDRTREPLLVEDAMLDDRFSRDPYFASLQQCSLLMVPIDSQGVPRAILLLENRFSSSAFSADRLDAVMLIAGQLAVSLENALLYASLERKVQERTDALEAANRSLALLSATDPLTGIPNRRRFSEVLQTEWARAMRPGASIGLAMIDVDQFKLYNDHYGHPAGDICLQSVASTLKNSLRTTADIVARYGGEEFVLVLPGMNLAETHAACKRLCSEIAKLCLPHETSGHGIVTVSVGVTAVVPTAGDNPERHIEVADAALYAAKRAGRNQVAVAPE